jgi:hypothetical protein
MDFNFEDLFDPEHMEKMLERMKSAHRKAAAADSGDAQDKFQTLSRAFNKAVEPILNPDPDREPDQQAMMKEFGEYSKIMAETVRSAQNDPQARAVMAELQKDISTAQKEMFASMKEAFMKKVMGGLGGGLGGGFGGLGGGDIGDKLKDLLDKGMNKPGSVGPSNDDDEAPKAAPAKKPKGPKKGGGKKPGSYDL